MPGLKRFSPPASYSPFWARYWGERVHKVGIASAVAVAEQVGGLVQHGNVLVLIDDGHLGLVLLCFLGAGLRAAGFAPSGGKNSSLMYSSMVARLEPILRAPFCR